MTTLPAPTPRELAHRRTDGIDVQLLWHPDADRVTVQVDDTKAGERFELEVRAGERALEVFHHPYAYRAVREAEARRRAPVLTG